MDLAIGTNPILSTLPVQGNLMMQVGATMLDKQLDAAASGIAELTKSMELSVNPNLGANFDMSV